MAIHKSVTLERITDLVEADENQGLCLGCGADAYGVEPDARQYECEECGKHAVYGAEELLVIYA